MNGLQGELATSKDEQNTLKRSIKEQVGNIAGLTQQLVEVASGMFKPADNFDSLKEVLRSCFRKPKRDKGKNRKLKGKIKS